MPRYKYDAWNRLVEVKDLASNNLIQQNEYDGLNRRIVRSVYASGTLSHSIHYYYNEKWQIVEERKEVNGTEIAQPLNQYVWHPYYVDALAYRRYDADTDGNLAENADGEYYYLQDANYNVTAVVDDAGAVVERNAYTPYGDVTVLESNFASDPDSASDIGNTHLYTGRERDPETGLQLNRNRFYASHLGRWLTRDPIGYEGSQWNLYQYVDSRPVLYVDATGELIGVVGAIGVGCCFGCGSWIGSTAEACFNGPCANANDRGECTYDCVKAIYGQLGTFNGIVLNSECGVCAAAAVLKVHAWCRANPAICADILDMLTPWN